MHASTHVLGGDCIVRQTPPIPMTGHHLVYR